MADKGQEFIRVRQWETQSGPTHGFGLACFDVDFQNADELELERLKHESLDFAKAGALNSCNHRFTELLTVKQIHSNNILVVGKDDLFVPGSDQIRCDGIVSNRPGLMIGIKTADCVPILLYAPNSKAIGALHSGWRGTINDIASQGVEKMAINFGVAPSEIQAAIGPGIGPCCYEVENSLAQDFRNVFGGNSVGKTTDGKVSLDLGTCIEMQLLEAGLEPQNIINVSTCTACSDRSFYSWRRDGGRTGRLLNFIALPTDAI